MRQDIEELMETINAQHSREIGGPIVQTADDITNPFLLRRPTGIPNLDIAIAGGWPAGTLCQISAPEGVGKNALCCQTIAMAQEIYGEDSCIAWVCTEMTLDKMFAHMFGVVIPMSQYEIEMCNISRANMNLKPMNEVEEEFRKKKLGQFVIVDSGSSSQRLEVALKLVESNKFQIVVIDSLASLLTEVQDETDLQDEPQQASEARLITRFCNKYWGRSGRSHSLEDRANWTTVLVTYQARSNRSNAVYKKSWTVGGAHALRHAKAIDLHMDRGDRYPKDPAKPQRGKEIKWKVSKGKAGCSEGGQGKVLYLAKTGFDLCGDLINCAKKVGALVSAGKHWKWVDSDNKEVEKFTGGLEGVAASLSEEEVFWRMYKDVIRRGGVECAFKL